MFNQIYTILAKKSNFQEYYDSIFNFYSVLGNTFLYSWHNNENILQNDHNVTYYVISMKRRVTNVKMFLRISYIAAKSRTTISCINIRYNTSQTFCHEIKRLILLKI